MCGRYGFIPPHDFYKMFEIVNDDFELEPNYNTAPGQFMPIITMNSPKTLTKMKWGLVPHWAKDPKIGFSMINARSEGIEAKPSFRGPIKNKRCLIPASGFFEWDRKGDKKIPHYFKLKKRDVFVFAGLYEVWRDAGDMEWKTYTIITTEANPVVGEIHDRMPVILDRDDEELWADNSSYEPEKLLKLLKPYPGTEMKTYKVSELVNSSKNNSEDLVQPI